MITYFKDKNNKSKKKHRKHKIITTILKSFYTFVIIAKTSSSITMSLTGIGLTAIPISTATACGLPIGNEVIYGIILIKYKKYKKEYHKDQQTKKSFDILYRKNLQNIVIDGNEYECLCYVFGKYLEESKSDFLL